MLTTTEVFLFTLLVVFPVLSEAQTLITGLDWNKYSFNDKVAYIQGFNEGIIFTFSQYSQDLDIKAEEKTTEKLTAFLENHLPAQASFQLIVNYLDAFYKDSKAAYIPVNIAITIMAKEVRGEDGGKEAYMKIFNLERIK